MRQFLYVCTKEGYAAKAYEIGVTTDPLTTFKLKNHKSVIDIIRCSNSDELLKEITDTFSDKLLSSNNIFELEETEIESLHLIIRAKSQL